MTEREYHDDSSWEIRTVSQSKVVGKTHQLFFQAFHPPACATSAIFLIAMHAIPRRYQLRKPPEDPSNKAFGTCRECGCVTCFFVLYLPSPPPLILLFRTNKPVERQPLADVRKWNQTLKGSLHDVLFLKRTKSDFSALGESR